jgi:chloramphenicol O-acetyltransferase type A
LGHFIELESWSRKAIYEFFLQFDDPWFNLTTELEVGPTRRWCRANNASFSLACWYAVLRASNEVEAFRMRLRDGGVWVHERVRVGATALRPDQTFTYVYFPDAPDFTRFAARAKAETAVRLEAKGLEPDSGDDDLLHCTVVPWVRFTGIKHARFGDAADSVPKIALGRATEEGDAVRMPVSVEGHHALIDGVHAGAFFEALAAAFSYPDGLLG